MKKIISMLLVVVMVFSLALPAMVALKADILRLLDKEGMHDA